MPTRSPLGRVVRTLLTGGFLRCSWDVLAWAAYGAPGPRGSWSGVGPRRVTGEVQESSGESPPVAVGADDQHGVVAGDGAQDAGEAGLVQRRGEELRGPRGRPQHHQVAGVV